MIRERMMAGVKTDRQGFRWRGTEVNRVEALSDAVFGFAITLLVVSVDPPRTATQLFEVMRGFFSFAACFAMLFLVWFHQYRFFRRYGLQDTVTIALNAVLLFTVVFFIYPLRFVYSFVIDTLILGEWSVTLADGRVAPVVEGAQAVHIMVVFSAGYMAVFAVFALLHVHAWRLRGALELSELEVFDTVDNVRESLLNVAIGIVSLGFALGMGSGTLAGMTYALVGPVMGLNGYLGGRARARLEAKLGTGAEMETAAVPVGSAAVTGG